MRPDELYSTAARFGGVPHGADANGVADIEFPDIAKASAWASAWADLTKVRLRDPVTSLDAPVVIQVQL